jgi:hypothetical protein
MIAASEAQCARLEICGSAESNAGIVGLRTKPLPSRDRVWSQFIPARVRPQLQTQQIGVVMMEYPASSGPNVQQGRQCSPRIRDFREWNRMMASLLRGEHGADLVTGDFGML